MIETAQWLISTNEAHGSGVFSAAEEESSKHQTFQYIDKGKLHDDNDDEEEEEDYGTAWRILRFEETYLREDSFAYDYRVSYGEGKCRE